jgi:16S rRNA (cytidine1402-2'-O)-methyltransferase
VTGVRDGCLVLVATPIGNLGDLTERAKETLAAADVVVCEDSRRTGRLLQHAGIAARRLLVVNDHNEAERVAAVSARLDAGDLVAVVTDAGMPGISDPGERLVRAAIEHGHNVDVVPGASAVVAALVVSGLPTARFAFDGFLPRKGSARAARLEELGAEERTIVLYEAPHRLARALADLASTLGPDRSIAVCRELTKLHQEIWRGPIGEAAARWSGEVEAKGEFVLVIAGAPAPAAPSTATLEAAVDAELETGASRRDAAASVAAALGVSRREAYAVALRRPPPPGR